MGILLYRAPFSTNVERVALALAHKGLEVESVVIDYSDRSPVIEASGQPLVPVIVDEGQVVSDSLAILRHLEERRPEPPLFPLEPARRAELDVFLEWFDGVWKGPPNAIEAELGRPRPDRARIAALGARMDGWLDLFERMLDGRDHLFGGFSAADCAAFPFLKGASPGTTSSSTACSTNTRRATAVRGWRLGSSAWTRCRAPTAPRRAEGTAADPGPR